MARGRRSTAGGLAGALVGGLVLVGASVGAALPAVAAEVGEADPPYSVDGELLDASLDCPEAFSHPDREPVLLVHGTFTHGHEQYDWNYLLVLPDLGFDVCVVTYPDRGLGDQQVSAEYVAHAVITMHEATGRKVDLVGHSQGASMPRWAMRFWPSARAAVDDYVGIAGPYHGIFGDSPGGFMQPEATWQFGPGSDFVTTLNDGDETPGDIDWTNLYSQFDQLVQPIETAQLDRGLDNPKVANILLQDWCPGRVVDHLTIGTTDRLAFDLVLDAFTNPGPADPGRLGLTPACSVADQIVDPAGQGEAFAALLLTSLQGGFPDMHLTTSEPPLMAYATGDAPAPTDDDTDPARTDDDTDPTPDPTVDPTAAVDDDEVDRDPLPVTGGALVVPALIALAAVGRLRRP